MRKTVLILLLAVVSSSAAAEWIAIGSNENATAYANPVTIRKVGNVAKMWGMYDYKIAQVNGVSGKRFMSTKTQYEYDCKEEQARLLYGSEYSGNMGEGKTVFSQPGPGKWEAVSPGSGTEVLWKFACGKR